MRSEDDQGIVVRITDAMASHLGLGHLEGVQEKYPDTRIEGRRLIGSRDALESLHSSVMEHARAMWEEKSMSNRTANTVMALRDRLESATGNVIPEGDRMQWFGVIRDPRLKIPTRNPGKPKHLRQAREKLQSAKGLYRSVRDAGEGEAGFRQEILLYAHATAAQAMQEAANAGAPGLRDEAYRLQQQIEQHLSRLRRPGQTNPIENPCVRRFKDLPTAQRDAARRAQRTDQPYFIYELSKNPRFAVMSADHPVQQSYEKGVIGLGRARLRATVNPPGTNPYETEGKAQVAGLGLHKDSYTYRGYEIRVQQSLLGGEQLWKALVVGPSKSRTAGVVGTARTDQAGILEMGRLHIDREIYVRSLSDADREHFRIMEQILANNITDDLTRAALAREIEIFRTDEQGEWIRDCEPEEDPFAGDGGPDCLDTWHYLRAFEFFDSLSLKDRIRWLDSFVKEERLRRGLPLTNPRRAKPKKNPGRSSFRRLMRL